MLGNRDPRPVSQNSTNAREVTPAPPTTIYNPFIPTVQPHNQNFIIHQKPCGYVYQQSTCRDAKTSMKQICSEDADLGHTVEQVTVIVKTPSVTVVNAAVQVTCISLAHYHSLVRKA